MFWREQRLKWTDEHRRTLRALEVSEDGPGTVLRDFQMLLSFVRERELPASKTYQLPPRKVLPEINARLAQPIELGLKQPQLKSYPHIHGLYLVLAENDVRLMKQPTRASNPYGLLTAGE